MRRWIIGAVLGLGLAGLDFAGTASAQGAEIKGVIGSQIEAFQADDFATAFTYASPTIRGIFGSPSNFGRMVTQGFPMVWRPAQVEYLELRDEGGQLTQRVRVVDQAGRVHVLDYFMTQTGDGWKINGVQLVEQPGLSI